MGKLFSNTSSTHVILATLTFKMFWSNKIEEFYDIRLLHYFFDDHVCILKWLLYIFITKIRALWLYFFGIKKHIVSVSSFSIIQKFTLINTKLHKFIFYYLIFYPIFVKLEAHWRFNLRRKANCLTSSNKIMIVIINFLIFQLYFMTNFPGLILDTV